MKRFLGVLPALALLASVGTAAAGEATGVLMHVDQETRTVVMDNGTVYGIKEGIAVDQLSAGQEVKITFEENTEDKVVPRVITEIAPKE
jgi:hypothetical protein